MAVEWHLFIIVLMVSHYTMHNAHKSTDRTEQIYFFVLESNVEIFDFLLATLINKCNIPPRDAAIQHVVDLMAGLSSLQCSEQHEESLLDICEQKQLLSKSVVLRHLDLNAIKAKLQQKNEEIQSMYT